MMPPLPSLPPTPPRCRCRSNSSRRRDPWREIVSRSSRTSVINDEVAVTKAAPTRPQMIPRTPNA
eukprot:scaffold52681_cov37-Tisochrysis_lutea.AAC.5